MHTHTHRHTLTHNRALSSRETLLFGAHNCLCVCVSRLVQKVLDNEVCHQGDVDFYLSFSLSFSCPSPPSHLDPPHQLTENKGADGGRKGGVGVRERDRNRRKGSLLRLEFPWLPQMQEEQTAQCHCECPVCERKHKYRIHRWEAFPPTHECKITHLAHIMHKL